MSNAYGETLRAARGPTRIGRWERARRETSNWQALAILATTAALVLGATAAMETLMLDQAAVQRKALPTVLVCYDAAGVQTEGDFWKRCDRVHYIPAHHEG